MNSATGIILKMTLPSLRIRLLTILSCLFATALSPAGIAQALPPTSRVVVVRNVNSAISRNVADDYMLRRGVSNMLNIACQDAAANTTGETISLEDYLRDVEAPLRAWLAAHPGIDFIVLTKGIPVRIRGVADGAWGNCSLDSRIAALGYDTVAGAHRVLISDSNYGPDYHGAAWSNRFWNSRLRFSRAAFGGWLVTRLDGYTEADAKALTTRALLAESHSDTGRVLLDQCPGYGLGDVRAQPFRVLPATAKPGDTVRILHESAFGDFNADMQLAADSLATRGIAVELEGTPRFAGSRPGLRGYVSWGSNDAAYDPASYHSLAFAPGALCETAVSTSARTFLPTVGGQSLMPDLIAQGATGVKGYTDEPLLQAIASPSILFDRFTRGWTLAEAYYAASNLIGWMDVVIGDPLAKITDGLPSGLGAVTPGQWSMDAYPNPCSASGAAAPLTVRYTVPSRAHVRVELFNALGAKLATLVDAEQSAGTHHAQASSAQRGVCFLRLQSGTTSVQKLLIVAD
jgi:uncharacterized protein (TIGR03790 family)